MTKSLLSIFSLLFYFAASSQALEATLIEKNFSQGSNPWNLTSIDDKIYFSAITHTGREPWVYDTTSGTATMLQDIIEGTNSGMDNTKFVKAGNDVFFVAEGFQYDALWLTDGTVEGTHLVKQFLTSTNNQTRILGTTNGKLIFCTNEGGFGEEVWVSDGTADGTVLLKDISPGQYDSSPNSIAVINGDLYFSAYNGTYKCWKTDGTPEGTVLSEVQNITGDVIEMNGNYYYYASDYTYGSELWKTDGTLAGTQIVKNIFPGISGSSPMFVGAKLNNQILFVARTTGTGLQLWSTDGTSDGTMLLKTINPTGDAFFTGFQEQKFVSYNGKIYFGAYTPETGIELWASDGTEAGTAMLKDINPGFDSGAPALLTSTGDFLVFNAIIGGNINSVRSLWTSDGTVEGTVLLHASPGVTGNTSMEFEIVTNNGDAYFQAGYNYPNGVEIWKTSGTPETTEVLVEVNHNGGTDPSFFTHGGKAELNGKLIFFGIKAGVGYQPYISDGTDEGTYLIKQLGQGNCVDLYNEVNPMLTKAGNKLYFRGTDGETGYEIFVTDGTSEGTGRVKDIAPGYTSSIAASPMFMTYNDVFFFVADDMVHGFELWRTDGTEEGTFMLKDIFEGAGHGFNGQANAAQGQTGYAVFNGFLYFTANNGTQTSVYKTDGTAAGTQLAFNPYNSGPYDTLPKIIDVANNKLFYATNLDNQSSGNHALWSCDGTAGSSILLGDYGSSSSQFQKTVIFNNTLYYSAYLNGYGLCLMKSNGTVAGTSIVKNGFEQNWNFKYMSVCGEFIYFAFGEYGLPSYQLWRTDGTTAGTIQIDGTTISGNQYFRDFTCIDQTLAYSSYDTGVAINLTNGFVESNEIKEIEVLNGDDFSEYSSLSGIGGVIDGKIYFSASSNIGGNELYVAEAAPLLGLSQHGTTDISSTSIRVYPNPNNGRMTVQTNDLSTITAIDVYESTGKKIISSQHNANSVELNLANLSKGLYIIKTHSESGVHTTKVVIR